MRRAALGTITAGGDARYSATYALRCNDGRCLGLPADDERATRHPDIGTSGIQNARHIRMGGVLGSVLRSSGGASSDDYLDVLRADDAARTARKENTGMSAKGMGTAEYAARWAGILLALAAIATVVAVVGRVSADADQPTLMGSLTAISENVFAYGIGGLARLVSGAALVGGASMLLKTWIIRERFSTPRAPALFIISGIFTALSGLCAVVLAATAPDMVAFGAPSPSTEVIASFRWMAGKGRLYDGWSGADCRVALSVEGGRDSQAHCALYPRSLEQPCSSSGWMPLPPFTRSPRAVRRVAYAHGRYALHGTGWSGTS